MKLGGNLLKQVDIFFIFCIILRRLLTGRDSDAGQVAAAIDILTEDALIEIFDLCLDYGDGHNSWHTLVHVCRRWSNIVFGSSSYLMLVLLCHPRTPVRQSLDIWPPLPITIHDDNGYPTSGLDNVIAALEHNDRVYEVMLRDLSISQLQEVAATLGRPFPELAYLELHTDESEVPNLPHPLLGGSAPRLEELRLSGIPFMGLPSLLSSTRSLESLHLCYIPHLSPNIVLSYLSALTSLEELRIEFPFECCLRCLLTTRGPRRRRRIFLPVLRRFSLAGSSRYVEDLAAWINAPLLEHLVINLADERVLDTPQLVRLINRTRMFKAPIEARVLFEVSAGRVILPSSKRIIGTEAVTVNIGCEVLFGQHFCLTQICSSLPSLS